MKTALMQLLFLMVLGAIPILSKGQTALFSTKIVASDRQPDDRFGDNRAVAIHGDYAVVGAQLEDTDGTDAGEAYLYRWNHDLCIWEQTDQIFGEDVTGTSVGAAGDRFGSSVAIFDRTIAIGAWRDANNGADGLGPIEDGAGIVYIYRINAMNQAEFVENVYQFNNLGAEDQQGADGFGWSVDLSSKHLIVGSIQEDFDGDGGDMVDWAGGAFIYRRMGGSYVFQRKITAPVREGDDQFGMSVAIDGDYAAVGAPRDGVGTSPMGDGLVYIFRWNGFDWEFWEELAPVVDLVDPDWDWFGFSIDMWGDRLIVGSYVDSHDELEVKDFGDFTPGSAYIYELEDTNWLLAQKIVASNRGPGDFFGIDVGIFEDFAIVGAIHEDTGGGNAGSAYIFRRDDTGWNEIQHVLAPDASFGDRFGQSVDIFQECFIVSASQEDHDDEEPYDGGFLSNAGSAYMYKLVDLPDEPVIAASAESICNPGSSLTLSIESGELGDAEYWVWYEDDCDGIPIDVGTSITVTPSETTTYCARGENDCEWFISDACGCITIEVEDINYWHQSTQEGLYDQANDVITDAAGGVYITGQYYDQTVFNGGGTGPENIVSGEADTKSYVAKYDDCGTLRWVAWSDNIMTDDDNYGTSITLDENNGLVYAVGNFKNIIRYNGAIGLDAGPFSTLTTTATGEQAYVACFNMSDGELNHINTVSLDPATKTRLNAITINENNGRIFIGGYQEMAPPLKKSFVQRYSPTVSPATTIGAAEWLIEGTAALFDYVNDLDYDEDVGDEGSLWIIGDYKFGLALTPGTDWLASNHQDAYLAKYQDGPVPIQEFLVMGGVNGKMSGEGVAVDAETGNAYFTGHYNGIATGAFEMAGQNLPTSGYQRSYFMAMDANGFPIWPLAHHTFITLDVIVEGNAVAYRDGQAYFTGTYNGGPIMFTGGGPLNYLGGSSNEPHIYVVNYDATSGAYGWKNATKDFASGSARHLSNAITTDAYGHAFIAGGYSQIMDYWFGDPASGILASTGQLETFTMRVDLTSPVGALESTIPDPNQEVVRNVVDAGTILVHPNPAKDRVSVILNQLDQHKDFELKLYNVAGKKLYHTSVNSDQIELDLSDLTNGIYIIHLVSGSEVYQAKLMKGD